ncbi:extracellular solute-binding protein, family 3 [Sporobacter termitidis DSM 10068]|uniref:Extracellular solute-binding protein, family 3 n=1 Tax=Sporobacter termitidis DSM 10068 TaxID=1123282 RepID=A0A1M5YVN5_9FIRM|nr:transporter substrate-binding domain-containing protein [Sporobacter termitidis]SHI16061.1 extracellular solute-binding protein, family 3 [Sporobacter termitidis DSM 10068]
MKKTWKVIAALLTLVMIFGVSACSGQKAPAASPSAGAPKLKILDTAYAQEDYAICVKKGSTELLDKINTALKGLIDDGTVKKIVDNYINNVPYDLTFQQKTDGLPELKMGTNAAFPPYEFLQGDKIVGIDADIAAAIADKLSMKLVISDMDFDSVIAAVSSGKVDMGMAGMTVTPERQQNVDFSASYATGIQSIIVPGDSKITSIDDLSAEGATYTIGVQQNTTGDIYASDEFGTDRVQQFNNGADAVQALLTGKIDCVIIDNEPAKAFVAANS